MTSSVASEYLARTLFLRSEDDLDFVFEASRLIEPILINDVLAIVPCHVNDIKAGAETCRLIRVQGASVCIFVNCLEHEFSEDELQSSLNECRSYLEQAGCRIGCDTALIARRQGSVPNMGKVRGSIADACLIASMNIGAIIPFAFLDADTLHISSTYFNSVRAAFRGKYRPMMAVGAVHYGYYPDGKSCLPGKADVPELLLADRVNQAILQCARNGQINYERRVWAEGASLIFDPIAYCRVGGFNWQQRSGEDDAFGRAMHRYNPRALEFPLHDVERVFEICSENIVFVGEAWLVTNPRRYLKAIAQGGGGTEAWDYAPFDQQPGHELSLQRLVDEYEATVGRITRGMLATWEEQNSLIKPWATIRVINLVTRMLQADRRIRNEAQANSVWAQLGFAAGAPSLKPDDEETHACRNLLRAR